MKIFVSGSKAFNAGLLPESVCTCLDGLMTDGNEVLIGDCPGIDTAVQGYISASGYKQVKVYASGSHKATRSNIGRWEEKWFSAIGETPYAHRIEKDFHMAEDCDSGLAIWDGKSKGTFINMLCLCALQKTCKVYLLKEEGWINVESLEDLRGLTGSDGISSEEDVLSKRNLKSEAFASVEENIKQGKPFAAIKQDIRALADFRGEESFGQ